MSAAPPNPCSVRCYPAGLTEAGWAAVEAVAPSGRAIELASLLVDVHLPRTMKDADAIILYLVRHAPRGAVVRRNLRLRDGAVARLDELEAELLGRGYNPSVLSKNLLIRAIVFAHTPRTRQAALKLWCSAGANVPPLNYRSRTLADDDAPAMIVRVPRGSARQIDLVRFELRAVHRGVRLDRLLLGSLIWAHTNQDGLDKLTAQPLSFESALSMTDCADVACPLPTTLRRRLDDIADALYWQSSVRARRLAGTLLCAHAVTGTQNPDGFARLGSLGLEYAAAGGFPAATVTTLPRAGSTCPRCA